MQMQELIAGTSLNFLTAGGAYPAGFSKDAYGLTPVPRVESYRGFIFASLAIIVLLVQSTLWWPVRLWAIAEEGLCASCSAAWMITSATVRASAACLRRSSSAWRSSAEMPAQSTVTRSRTPLRQSPKLPTTM